MNIQVLALYQFKSVQDPEAVKAQILGAAPDDVLGTLILAKEGINGTISGSESSMALMLDTLKLQGFSDMEYKFSYATDVPFLRFKVLVKDEIVTLGQQVDPCSLVGEYVAPEDWNALITSPDVLVIDTRNDYEYALGTFKGAVNPKTESFREFPAFVAQIDQSKYKRVAMFCTGGIRCEKASAYMLQAGFSEVFHLKGGILQYLEDIAEQDSLWQGSCFVFDRRVAVGHGLSLTDYKSCYACRRVLTKEEQMSPDYQKGVSCSYCINTIDSKKQDAFRQRQKQVELASLRGEQHIGA